MAHLDGMWPYLLVVAGFTWCSMMDGALEQSARKEPSPGRGLAVVVNSGSTNTSGFRLRVERSGKTEMEVLRRRPRILPPGTPGGADAPIRTSGKILAELAERLYADLEAAWPLSALPEQHCFKSASFGSRLTIEYGGQSTPDLSCPGGVEDPKLRALVEDARQVVAANRGAEAAGK